MPAELEDMPRRPLVAVLENIRSLWNVGSIFRTADAVRVAELYLAGYTPVPPRKEIDKTALGATESVPWQHFADAQVAVEQARKKGYRIWVLEQTAGGEDLLTLEVKEPVALVLGNEVWGVSDDIVKMFHDKNYIRYSEVGHWDRGLMMEYVARILLPHIDFTKDTELIRNWKEELNGS